MQKQEGLSINWKAVTADRLLQNGLSPKNTAIVITTIENVIADLIKRAKAEGVRLGRIEEASRCVEHEEKAREEERESTTDFIKTIHTELHNGRMEDAYRLLCKFLNALAE